MKTYSSCSSRRKEALKFSSLPRETIRASLRRLLQSEFSFSSRCKVLGLTVVCCLLFQTTLAGILDNSTQLILVTTKDWTNVDGSLQRFDRSGSNWKPVGKPIPIVVGRS